MRIWLRWVGLTVVCVAAVVASFSTLASLAEFTGWDPAASWLLPLALDALGMTACLVWLDATAPKKARRYAAWMTWIAAGLSVLGNGAGHLASTGHLQQGLLLVLLVGSVPPAALAVTVHLIVSVSQQAAKPARPVRDAAPVPAQQDRIVPGRTKPKPSPKPKPPPKPKVEAKSGLAPVKSGPDSESIVDDVRMQKARHLWKQHGGVSRDTLKTELEIGTDKATKLLAVLKTESEVA